jgi:formiminotetrahydrofolate cyclodeaminase
MTMITDQTIERFLDELASASPTPGGGSAAAITGAMGAALVAMVCNLTIGKKGYEAVDADMRALLEQTEALRARLTGMVAEDVAAFDALMASYKLPKTTDDEKAVRSAAIQAGLRQATEAPLACARACADVIRLADRAAEGGNANVISDAGVGVLAGWAALRSAALNVHINAPQIKDRAFADKALTELEALLAEGATLSEHVHDKVKRKLG